MSTRPKGTPAAIAALIFPGSRFEASGISMSMPAATYSVPWHAPQSETTKPLKP